MEKYQHPFRRLRPLCTIWFFIGMPLFLLLSGLSFIAGISPPPALFFLSSLTYLSGSTLGLLWSSEHLHSKRLSTSEQLGTVMVLILSSGFFCLSIIFAINALRRL